MVSNFVFVIQCLYLIRSSEKLMIRTWFTLSGFLLASTFCFSQNTQSWNYVDHIDERNQIDFLHPYNNGLIYVKSRNDCYQPSTRLYVDDSGASAKLYSSFLLAYNCQYYDNQDGRANIILVNL